MMIVPLKTAIDSYELLIVLESNNIERIKQYDPAMVDTTKMGTWGDLTLRKVHIGYLRSNEIPRFRELLRTSISQALAMVNRGFKYRPDEGDNDDNYTSTKIIVEN